MDGSGRRCPGGHPNGNPVGACAFQYPATFGQCRARGHHVVDQRNVPPGRSPGPLRAAVERPPDIPPALGRIEPRLGRCPASARQQAAHHPDAECVAKTPGDQVGLVEIPDKMAAAVQGNGCDRVRRLPCGTVHCSDQFHGQDVDAGQVAAELQAADQPIDRKPIIQTGDSPLPQRRPTQAGTAHRFAGMPKWQGAERTGVFGAGQVRPAGRTEVCRAASRAAQHTMTRHHQVEQGAGAGKPEGCSRLWEHGNGSVGLGCGVHTQRTPAQQWRLRDFAPAACRNSSLQLVRAGAGRHNSPRPGTRNNAGA